MTNDAMMKHTKTNPQVPMSTMPTKVKLLEIVFLSPVVYVVEVVVEVLVVKSFVIVVVVLVVVLPVVAAGYAYWRGPRVVRPVLAHARVLLCILKRRVNF